MMKYVLLPLPLLALSDLTVDTVSHFSRSILCTVSLSAMSNPYQIAFKSDGSMEEIEGEFAPSPMMQLLMGSVSQMLARKDAEDAAVRAAARAAMSAASGSADASSLLTQADDPIQDTAFIAEGLPDDPIEDDQEDAEDQPADAETPAKASASKKQKGKGRKKKSARKGH